VQYRLQGDRLERVAYRFVDGSAPLDAVTLVDGVRSLRLRYREPNGDWRERWDPTRPTDMPVAVEMVLDVERGGSVRQLFLVGTWRMKRPVPDASEALHCSRSFCSWQSWVPCPLPRSSGCACPPASPPT
jgi:general secretion pathway protein J